MIPRLDFNDIKAGDTVYISTGGRTTSYLKREVTKVTATQIVVKMATYEQRFYKKNGREVASGDPWRRANLVSKETYDAHKERQDRERKVNELRSHLRAGPEKSLSELQSFLDKAQEMLTALTS